MSLYQAALAGDKARAECIYQAFYHDQTRIKDSWRSVDDALYKFGDKRPESIVTLLIRKICGQE